MEAQCKVAKLTGPEQISIFSEVMNMDPGPGNVLVKVEYTGICGSDVHFYTDSGSLPYPLELGHECAGTVICAGDGADSFVPGDRVALEPGKECGKCKYCRMGLYNLCENMDFLAAAPNFDGAFREYIIHPAKRCFKLPEHVSTLEGALLEPMAVGFYAAQRGRVSSGDRVLVIGAGCIGLMALLGANVAGAGEVISADIQDNRLRKAKEMGASKVLNTKDASVLKGLEADVVIDCSGARNGIEMALSGIRSGGRIVLVGVPLEKVPVEFAEFCIHEIEIIPIFRYRNMFPKLIDVLDRGIVDLKPMISSIYDLEDIQTAFRDAHYKKDTVTKNVVRIAG